MVKCPNCGKEADSKFCPNCGEKLQTKFVCPHCNEELEENTNFCPECGEKIEGKSKTKNTSNNKDKKYCPNCNEELDEEEALFCSNCGHRIEIDENSLNGIVQSIDFKRLIIASVLGFIITFVLGILFAYIMGLTGQKSFGYPIALIIAIFLGVSFFASFFKDILNSGLTGIIIGFLLGLLANTCIEISSGLQFSYDLFSGYEIIIFTVLGLVIAFIANKFLRDIILKYIDLDKLF
ncbi:MAG: zinc-ribbon domain-containing protein [Methanobrevibacter sp.]|nr:zinc-ribbon domain-containing protein [Methanobrevibacter sp.]